MMKHHFTCSSKADWCKYKNLELDQRLLSLRPKAGTSVEVTWKHDATEQLVTEIFRYRWCRLKLAVP